MDHPLTRTLDQVLMEFTIVWKLIAYTPSSRNVRENLALFYSHNILLLCHKSKVFPSISCPYFPRWHPLAMVTCMCQPSISWSPLRSVCPIGLSVLCHIGFSLHYFRVISNWLRVCFLLPLDVAWACSRIDGTPKQRRARISSRKLENNQTGKRLWHLLLFYLHSYPRPIQVWICIDLKKAWLVWLHFKAISGSKEGMKSHWSKKTTNREMISLKQEDEGKKQSKSKSISKTLSRCSFLIFFCKSQSSSLYQNCFFEDFFLGGRHDLGSFRNNFQPHTQHTVYGWKLHSCYWMCLFYSFGAFYGQPFVKHVTTREAFELFVYRK